MLYLVQRTDCARFRIAQTLDPAYATAYAQARATGVEILAFDTIISPKGIELGKPLPVF